MREWLLTKDGAPRSKLASKALADARPDLFAYLTQLADALLRRGGSAAAPPAPRRLAEAALTSIDAVRRDYAAAKRRRGVLDYDDLIVEDPAPCWMRRDAAPWVLYKLDGGIDHILIDEAQDTSPEQWAIVRKLTEEFFAGEGRERAAVRTIFAVGDEKQSIFSFQGADPGPVRHQPPLFRARWRPAPDRPSWTSR